MERCEAVFSISRSPDESKHRRDGSGEEESGESEVDEETEMMKKIMGFNKFDTTKVDLSFCSRRQLLCHCANFTKVVIFRKSLSTIQILGDISPDQPLRH